MLKPSGGSEKERGDREREERREREREKGMRERQREREERERGERKRERNRARKRKRERERKKHTTRDASRPRKVHDKKKATKGCSALGFFAILTLAAPETQQQFRLRKLAPCWV